MGSLRPYAWDIGLLGGVLCVQLLAHSLCLSGFGYFQDDFYILVSDFDYGAAAGRFSLGRPLSWLILGALRTAGQPWGLLGWHGVAAMVNALATAALYGLLRRLAASRLFAVLATLFWALYPLDKTQDWLGMALPNRPAWLVMFLALWLHASGRRWLAHGVAALVLLIYESLYPLFALAPWLEAAMRGEFPKRRAAALQLAAMGTLLLLYVGIRASFGENRMLSLDRATALQRSIWHMAWGPPLGVVKSALASLRGWPEVARTFPWAGALGLALVAGLCHSSSPGPERPSDRASWPLLVTALGLTCAGYSLTLAHDDLRRVQGAFTRIHFGATLGFALMFASLATPGWRWLQARGRQTLALLAVSLYFGGLLGTQFWRQKADVAAWSRQRDFYLELQRLCPDLLPQTVLLVAKEALPRYENMETFTGMGIFQLPSLIDFQASFGQVGRDYPPRMFAVQSHERKYAPLDWLWVTPYPQPRWILLEGSPGRLERKAVSFSLGEQRCQACPAPPGPHPQLVKTRAYAEMMRAWPSI